MPHFVIEYSREIEAQSDIDQLMDAVLGVATDSGIMNPVDVKIRARPYDHFLMPEKGQTFLHVTIFLLEGRTDAQKEQLSISLRSRLTELLSTVTSVSIDVRDMNPVAYKKRVLGS